MSISRFGRASRMAVSGKRVCPPAMIRASSPAASIAQAWSTSAGLAYSNDAGFIERRRPFLVSLLAGKLTGNFVDSGPALPFFAAGKQANSMGYCENSLRSGAGNFRARIREFFPRNREFDRACKSVVADCQRVTDARGWSRIFIKSHETWSDPFCDDRLRSRVSSASALNLSQSRRRFQSRGSSVIRFLQPTANVSIDEALTGFPSSAPQHGNSKKRFC